MVDEIPIYSSESTTQPQVQSSLPQDPQTAEILEKLREPQSPPVQTESLLNTSANSASGGSKSIIGVVIGVIVVIVIIAVVGFYLFSASSSPINVAKNNAQVKEFLAQHPAANVSISSFGTLELQTDNNFWSKNCPSDLNANNYYVLIVEDANSTYKALFDKSNMTFLCGVVQNAVLNSSPNTQGNTSGQGNNQSPSPNPQTSCVEHWTCANWSACDNTTQTRTCADSGNCGTDLNKPSITQQCSAICTENWSCGAWNTCASNTQSRTCTDLNACGTIANKPEITKSCTSACTENWSCTDWSACSSNTQTRTCSDASNCGTTLNKPSISQACSVQCTPNWSCSAWSTCSSNSQSRTCNDLSNCGTALNEPVLSQACVPTCTENWSCSAWGACTSGSQSRTCNDLSDCGTTISKPSLVQSCAQTCNDVSGQICHLSWGYNCNSILLASENSDYTKCCTLGQCIPKTCSERGINSCSNGQFCRIYNLAYATPDVEANQVCCSNACETLPVCGDGKCEYGEINSGNTAVRCLSNGANTYCNIQSCPADCGGG